MCVFCVAVCVEVWISSHGESAELTHSSIAQDIIDDELTQYIYH